MENRIREVRMEKKISGTKIAKEVGISPQYFYDIEKGERNLSADLAVKIAAALGVSLEEILLYNIENPPKGIPSMIAETLDINSEILDLLKLLIDDEGYFFEDVRRDLFNLIDKDGLFFYFSREKNSINRYGYEDFYHFFNEEEYVSDSVQKDIIEDFNSVFNYRTFKQILGYLEIDEKEKVLKGIKHIVEFHGIKQKETPNSNEKEFVNSLELSDDQLLERFNLTLDGKKLTEQEAKGVIAYLRSLRQMKDE